LVIMIKEPKPMNAGEQFCSNQHCPKRGQIKQGNITIHDRVRQRYRCKVCGKTFSERTGTMFEGLRKPADLILVVVTLLAWGCPIQAIVAAFGLDERTIADWRDRAGQHCARVHDNLVVQQSLDLQHVQLDEIRAKGVGKVIWLAMAIMVPTRLWLGGVVSTTRDRALAERLLKIVRLCAKTTGKVLVCVDGWAAYPKAIKRAFREKEKVVGPGQPQRGRPRLALWPQLAIGVVIKTKQAHKLVEVRREIVAGSRELVAALISASQGGLYLNTSYIERFNGTLRERLASLTRKCRHAARRVEALETGMYLVGTVYNFCVAHRELRVANYERVEQGRWQPRTPAMASGLSDHIWSVAELLKYKVVPPPFVPPKRRGRPPKKLVQNFTV
jgi:transposase-like protein